MTLTLIRHGLTEGNLKRLYYGSTDLPLTEAGIAALHSDPPAAPEAQDYYTSGMRRTEQTFAILFGERPHEIVRDLREIDFGHFEMRSYEELKDDPEFRHWCDECSEDAVCPGGESGSQATDRAARALRHIVARGRDAVFVIHGGIICGLLARWFGGTRFDYPCDPGHGYIIEFDSETPNSYSRI